MDAIKPVMSLLNAADVGGGCGASTDSGGNIEVVVMQHQAVGPYHTSINSFDQYYHKQQQQQQQLQQQQYQSIIPPIPHQAQQVQDAEGARDPLNSMLTIQQSALPNGDGQECLASHMQQQPQPQPLLVPQQTILSTKSPQQQQQQQQQLSSSPAEFPSITTSLINSGRLSAKPETWKSTEARRSNNYYCPACKRWLSRSGHLKRHYNTTVHKNAVKASGKQDPSTLPISAHYHPQRGQITASKPHSRRINTKAPTQQQQPPAPLQPPETFKSPLDFAQGAGGMDYMSQYFGLPSTTQQTQQAQMNGNLNSPLIGQAFYLVPSSQHELVSTTGELDDSSAGNNANATKKARKVISTTKKGPGRPAMKCRRSYPTCSINPRTVPLPNGRIKCIECDKDFTKPCYLTQHINSWHSGVYPYRCIKCGKRYQNLESYEVHILRHGAIEKPQKCNQCSKQFCYNSDLKRHVSNKHTGDKQHVCEVCNKSFSRKDHLNKHKGVHSKPKRVPKKMIGKDAVGQNMTTDTKSNEANENGEMTESISDLIDDVLLQMGDIELPTETIENVPINNSNYRTDPDLDDFSMSEFLNFNS